MAKERKIKVPKQIAGVKVPKKVRRAGNKALELADHPAALELAAAALAAAAAALQSKGRSRRAADVAPRLAELAGGAEGKGNGVGDATVKLGDLVKVAALEGARRLLDGMAGPKPAAAAAGPDAHGGGGGGDKPKRKKANGGRAAGEQREG